MNLLSRRQFAAVLAPLAVRLQALPLSALKLGITTDEIDDDPLAAAHFLRRYGLAWAEVRNIWGPYNTDQPLEKVRQAHAIFDEQGIHVSVLDTGFFKIPLPPDTPEGRRKLDEQWKVLDAAMERAAVFGTRKIRIFTFMLEKARNHRPGVTTELPNYYKRQHAAPDQAIFCWPWRTSAAATSLTERNRRNSLSG
jgi:hypothetical protein